METRVSTKGQIVLPGKIRDRLGLKPGDRLDASIEAGRVVLTPKHRRRFEFKVIPDPVTGMPVISAEGDVPLLTSEDVADILADFP
jgi:AbrB family looped-hinge helix DNA binding protein